MPTTIQSPISLTILRRGDMLLVDVAELGALIPRSETQVDDTFLQDLAAEVSQLATPGSGRSHAPLQTAIPPGREPERIVQELQRLGGVIFSHLFTEPVRTRLPTAEPCDLYLRLDEQLIQVPWELGFDGEHFLATKFRIGRQVITGYPLPATRTPRVRHGTLKVLLIADPTQSLPQAQAEAEQLYTLLDEIAEVKMTLMGGKNIRKLPLLAALQDHEVVHFAGHSEYDPATPHKSGWRLHEGILTAAELSKLTRPPLLVFSNSCQAGTTAAWEGGYRYEGQAFGIGSAFLLAGVQNYIGTFWVVHDEESVGFALAFYRSLATGMTLGAALHEAQQCTLQQRQGQGLTWASYMLYGNPTTALLPAPAGHPLSRPPAPGADREAPPVQTTIVSASGDSHELLPPQPEAHAEKSAVVSAHMARKLAAILSADVSGYSRLMGDDEEATIRTLAAYHGVMRRLIRQHRGRVVDSPGDNMLTEFASVVDAVRCAIEIQRALKVKNAELPPHRKMALRIGLNLGDVIVEGEKLYGDGVNIAARLESLAEPGSICISGTVYDQVENKLALGYEYVGEQVVKNIAKPVWVYRVREAPGMPAAPGVERERKGSSRYRRWATWAAVALLTLGAGLGAIKVLLPWLHDSSVTPLFEHSLLLPDKPSIVVLPFTNMSGDPSQDYFSDGMTEDITTDLSKISGLFIISRNSAFTYKGKAVKAQDVSREMGVRYVLEGSVRRAGDQLRITAQLIDATTGYHLWSERYDRPLTDIFAVQDEIVQQLVTMLRVKVQEAELERVWRIPTQNLTAYDLALRGGELLSRAWSETRKEANTQAQQLYEKAIKLDPLYAKAYVGLSSTYYADFFYHWSTVPVQSLTRAEELARQALLLDGSLAIAHRTLSAVALFKKQHDQAVVEAEQAVTLDPNEAESYDALGRVQVFAGRPEEGVKLIEKAIRLNPRYPPLYIFHLSCAYRVAERYAEALAPGKKAAALTPNAGYVHWNLTVIYSELGRLEEARAELAEVVRLQPAMSLEWVRKNLPYKDPVVLERHIAALRKAGLKRGMGTKLFSN